MQFNILQLYLNGLVKIFTFLEFSTSLHESNHPLWSYWNHYLNIAYCFNIYWNTHNNFMPHIYIWMGYWIFLHLLNYLTFARVESFTLNVVKSIIHELHFALIIIFWNGCIKTWEVSHLYLNGLMIRWKCSCI
jgi:hypothetical protein